MSSVVDPTGGADRAAEPQPPGPDQGRNTGELVMAALLGALGIYLILDAATIAVPDSTNAIGPRFFPYLVGGLVVATALALGLRVFRGDRVAGDESEDVDLDAPTSWRALGIVALAFFAHALLINVIGWPLAVTLMFGVVAWSLGARGIVRPLIAGGVTSVVVWIIFVKALDVALPGGTLLEFATSWF